jgi:hypothetical protein
VKLNQHGIWSLREEHRRLGFSVPLFARHGAVPPHPPQGAQYSVRAMKDAASLQITFHESKPGDQHPMPPGGFRLALVNCWSLKAGFAARKEIARAFPQSQVMLPE